MFSCVILSGHGCGNAFLLLLYNQMSTSPNDKGESPNPPTDKSPVILLLGIAGDTTWRMFVPVIGLAALGIWGDRTLQTKPWLTIVAIIVGIIIAGLLVRKQLQRD